jgi:hypothetical protein
VWLSGRSLRTDRDYPAERLASDITSIVLHGFAAGSALADLPQGRLPQAVAGACLRPWSLVPSGPAFRVPQPAIWRRGLSGWSALSMAAGVASVAPGP